MAIAEKFQTNTAVRREYRALAVFSIGWIVAWVTMAGSTATALGQSVTAPAQQSITHNGADAPQQFSEVVWNLITGPDVAGYITEWSCGPFVHSVNANLKADSELRVRVLSSEGQANWTTIVASDQTDYAAGNQTASVVLQSSSVGDGQAGLTVTFLNSDFSKLGAGDYTITVAGTITAK